MGEYISPVERLDIPKISRDELDWRDLSRSVWDDIRKANTDKTTKTEGMSEQEKLEFAKRTADTIIESGDIGKEAFDLIAAAIRKGEKSDLVEMINKALEGRSNLKVDISTRFIPVYTFPENGASRTFTSICLIDTEKAKQDADRRFTDIFKPGEVYSWPVRDETVIWRAVPGPGFREPPEISIRDFDYHPRTK